MKELCIKLVTEKQVYADFIYWQLNMDWTENNTEHKFCEYLCPW